jgi:YebC/PmpR family DNA-binding regulatory protein
MSGHSKWKTIKHKKAKEDSKRGKAFTKLIKEITICARQGGGDPNSNARLRLLMDKAKEINMPLENTLRAVKRGTGELPGVHYESMTYEGYGPYGTAIMIDTLTDNKNRTVAELRHLFSAGGGNLAETGAVNWMFEHQGLIVATGDTTEDRLLEDLLEHDIIDVNKNDDNQFSIYCDPKALMQVKNAVEDLGLKVESAEMAWVPKEMINLSEDDEKKAYDFLSEIEDHDDVQNVFTNLG